MKTFEQSVAETTPKTAKPWRVLERRWTSDFPYDWPSQDSVNRRQMLRWAVGVSGALFAMTSVLAALGFTNKREHGTSMPIVSADAIPIGGVHYFRYPDNTSDPANHAILLRLDENRYAAYGGKCTHLSCAVWWQQASGKLECPCHNGIFDPSTGDVVAGPPTRPLPAITLENRNGTLYAVKEAVR